jgi:YaaC-like Protein
VNVTPALSALSGGPRLTAGTLDDLAKPSREMVWRHLRALRHQPPGRASGGERRRVFGAALEQAQQLFTAASVHYASRPILLFYGLSQAGRAIAACSTKAGPNAWRLSGHGIDVPDLEQRPQLPDLAVADKGKGAFTQLAPLLHSGSLPDGALLGQI